MKRKNSRLAQESSTISAGTINKKRRLVKESELVLSHKRTTSSLSRKKPSLDGAGRGKEGSSQCVSGNLPTALIPNELGLHFPNSTPTSIVKLLNNHVFGTSPNLTNSRMVSIICHIVQSIEQTTSFASRAKGIFFPLLETIFACKFSCMCFVAFWGCFLT